MTPTRTTYRLAMQADYKALHRLATAAGLPGGRYQSPTVVVERDGALIGFAASHWLGRRLIVGPVVVAPQIRLKGLVSMRAVFKLEEYFKAAGLRYFLISTINPAVCRMCEALGYVPQGENDGALWYMRVLAQQPRQG